MEKFLKHKDHSEKFNKPSCKAGMGRKTSAGCGKAFKFISPISQVTGIPTCTVMAAFLVIVWYMPMKATLLSRS